MNLTQMTLEAFLCQSDNLQVIPPVESEMDYSIFHDFIGAHHRNLKDSSYSLHWFGGSEVNILLLDEQEIIGSYCGDMFSIAGSYQKRGLSVPVILAAVENRTPPTERKVTAAGRTALEKAWRVANGMETNPWP